MAGSRGWREGLLELQSENKAAFHLLGYSSRYQPWLSLQPSPSPHPGDARFSSLLPLGHLLPLTSLFPRLRPVSPPQSERGRQESKGAELCQ